MWAKRKFKGTRFTHNMSRYCLFSSIFSATLDFVGVKFILVISNCIFQISFPEKPNNLQSLQATTR